MEDIILGYDSTVNMRELDAFIKSRKVIELLNKINFPEDFFYSDMEPIFHDIYSSYPGLDKAVNNVKGKRKIGDYLYELYETKTKEHSDINLKMGINRAYWHKVTNGKIHPSKKKLLTLAIILKLNLEETEKLLRVAGYSLARELTTYESIFGYFIEKQIYRFTEIDEVLDYYGEKTVFSTE